MQCTPSHDSCRLKPYHLHTHMSSCKTLAAYRSIDTYKFVRSTPRIPADDEHKSASLQCHVRSKYHVVSSRSMTSDRQRQLHNLTETVDASPRASKLCNTVSRALETFQPLDRDRIPLRIFTLCNNTDVSELQSNCQVVTGRTVFFSKSAELECRNKSLSSRSWPDT
jgi:hypothetical protein